MPTFMIFARDGAGKGDLRAATRPRHLDHLGELGGRIVRAGPYLNAEGAAAGSLVLADFDDLAAAQAFAEADPYAQVGLFDEVLVAPWKHVLP